MPGRDPSALNPNSFLQAFIVQGIRVAETGCAQCGGSKDHVTQVGLATSGCLEEVARRHLGYRGPVDPDQYAALITEIKNRIGGDFERVPGETGSVRVVSHRCPFGELVKEAPALCRMTSSVFGAIAARNFGYAKVELHKRIAAGDGLCDVRVYLDQAVAALHPGDEYRGEGNQVSALSHAAAVTSRLEEKLCQAWCPPPEAARPQQLRRRIVAESQAMQAALRAVEVVAPTLASVLVTGETGVGKEVIARAVHALSRRADRVFLAVNCGAIPENLVESALFGHFLERLVQKYAGPRKVLGERAWAAALSYPWPGNLRELENVLERAYLFAPGSVIEDLPVESGGAREPAAGSLRAAKKRAAMEVEARVIEDALARAEGNVSAVARQMGITPRAVHMKLRAHGIDPGVYRARERRMR